MQNSTAARKSQNAPLVLRTNDLCQFGADADAIASAQREAWENAHRELRGRRAELRRLHRWAKPELIDDGIAFAARKAALEAVIAVAKKMIESPTPDAETVLRAD